MDRLGLSLDSFVWIVAIRVVFEGPFGRGLHYRIKVKTQALEDVDLVVGLLLDPYGHGSQHRLCFHGHEHGEAKFVPRKLTK